MENKILEIDWHNSMCKSKYGPHDIPYFNNRLNLKSANSLKS